MILPAALFVSLRESIRDSGSWRRMDSALEDREEGNGVEGMPEEQREVFRLIYALSLLFAERDEEIEKML